MIGRDEERVACDRAAGEAVGCKTAITSRASRVAGLAGLVCVRVVPSWACGYTGFI